MPAGRPTLYREEYVEEAEKHCLLGATDADLCEHFGIGESTLYEWKNKFPEFAEAIKRGKAPANADVAHKLYQRATGAEWIEEQAFKVKTVEYSDGKRLRETEEIKVVEVKRAAPPDTAAAIFWLKNRRPDLWRDKQQHEHTGKDGGPIETADVTDRDRAKAMAALMLKAKDVGGTG